MKWLLRLALFRVLGARFMLTLAVIDFFRSVFKRGRRPVDRSELGTRDWREHDVER